MLFARYARPFDLIDNMIESCRLNEFIDEIIRIKKHEIEEKTMWEFYIHRIYDKTYEEYLEIAKNGNKKNSMDFETTINNSHNILEGFIPEQ